MATGLQCPAIDYLKFIFATDDAIWQEKFQDDFVRLQADATAFGAKRQYFKITVLGGGRTVGTRYVVEIVGPVADYLAPRIPLEWFRRCTRVDYRTPLRELAAADLDRASAYYLLTRAKQRNIAALDTQPRRKAVGRDVGGKGITLASRKSGVCGAIYRRGAELPAYELRLINNDCAELRDEAFANYPLSSPSEFLNCVYALSADVEKGLLNETLQIDTPAEIAETFALVARTMPDPETLPTVAQLRLGVEEAESAGEDKARQEADVWAQEEADRMMRETSRSAVEAWRKRRGL